MVIFHFCNCSSALIFDISFTIIYILFFPHAQSVHTQSLETYSITRARAHIHTHPHTPGCSLLRTCSTGERERERKRERDRERQRLSERMSGWMLL